jgi:hypothetical protein
MAMPDDDDTFINPPLALKYAIHESLHQDAILLPAAIALLRNTKIALQ